MIKKFIKHKVSEETFYQLRKKYRKFLSYFYSKNLNKLATIHDTDKWNFHWYTQHYMRHFSKIRLKKMKILEIGIGGYKNPKAGGDSLRMWKHYFPFSQIHGIDIYDKSFHQESRIFIHQGSQIDEDFLIKLIDDFGPFDIIIDDGSHINEHVIKSFNILFPKMKNGGIYVVEDTQTSYWSDYGGDSENLNNTNTMLFYFKSLTDKLNYFEYAKENQRPDEFDNKIVGMNFYHNLVFIEKGDNSKI